jgi:uncharacterized repeat protein (TIGR03803 family)
MQTKRFSLPLFVLTLTLCIAAAAQDSRHLKVLHTFSAPTTANPDALVQDSAGNFYGTTSWGGRLAQCGGDGCGGVFRLSPNGSGWTYTVLYEFAKNQGAEPGSLVIDSAGNLYGVFAEGGTYDAGVVFELSPTTSGPWTYTNLYTFTGDADGENPNGFLAWDGSGNLYGMTDFGGALEGPYGYGTVFELSPNGSGGWNFSTQYSFDSISGHPSGALVFDEDGNAYGVSTEANSQGPGGVFELSPGAGGWTLTSLYKFTSGSSGELPEGGLIRDALGNLYGTTITGGQFGNGTVFELSPEAGGGYNFTVVYSLNKADGKSYEPVVMDSSGNLFGSTVYGAAQWGMIYELSPSDSGWKFGLVHEFSGGADGGFAGGLTLDSTGNIYGPAAYGANAGCVNNSGCGTVFELAAPAPLGR